MLHFHKKLLSSFWGGRQISESRQHPSHFATTADGSISDFGQWWSDFKCPQYNLELLSTERERERAWKLHHCHRSQLIHVQDNTEMLLIKCTPLKKLHFRSVYFLKSCYNILKNMTHFFMDTPLHLKDCSSFKGHFK